MKVRLLLPLVLLILVGCGDPVPRDLDTFVRQGDLYLDPETMTPYSGPVFSLYPGTQDLKEKGNLKDGVWSDPYEYYFHDGQLWFSGSHDLPRDGDDLIRQGGLDLDPETMEPYTGPFVRFNGDKVQMRGAYSNGEQYGPAETYHENGRLQFSTSYSDGEFYGPIKEFYENGQLKKMHTNSNGKLDGPFEEYHENGQLSRMGSYSTNLQPVGRWLAYYDNGQLMWEGSYSNGEQEGPWEEYYENGQLREKGSYSNGEREGPWEAHHENGQLANEGSYFNGKPDGPWSWYDENGSFIGRGSQSNGKPCGEWTTEDGDNVSFPPCPNG